jgi:PST family polysaccharide transporter
MLLMGLAGLVMARRDFPIRFVFPSAAVLKRELAEGWHLFLSRMATTLYTTSNTVILGLFASSTLVAYYAAGDKIVRAIQGLQLPLSQAIFPHIGRLASESKAAALAFTAKVGKLVSIVTLVLSAALFLTAPQVVRLVLGEQFAPSVTVVRILSLLPFIIGLSNILGVQVMVNFGLTKALTRILATAGAIDLILAFALVVPLHYIGVSIAMLVAEIYITMAMYVTLRHRGLDIFGPPHATEVDDVL